MSRAKKEQITKSFYDDVLLHLFGDFTRLYPYDFSRDYQVVKRRTDAEGPSFLSKTLNKYSRSILECLDKGVYEPAFTGFSTDRRGCPLFLGGLVSKLFDFWNGGIVYDEPDTLAIKLIHQLGELFYKIKTPFSESQERAAVAEYKQLEEWYPVMAWEGHYSDFVYKVLDNARCIIKDVLKDDLSLQDIIPRHGPGAVANGERYGEKYIFHVDDRLNAYYPYDIYFTTDSFSCEEGFQYDNDVIDSKNRVHDRWFLDPLCDCGPARMCLVPKTSKGPRVIQAEPKERQWIQQGQGRRLVELINGHALTRGHVNFADQSINQKLALEGSRDGRLATIDWAEASDRIGLRLVQLIWPEETFGALVASRSEFVELVGGEIISLSKFAGMGSAVCFPIEALTFFALTVGYISAVTGGDFRRSARGVYVYGDDLIVPQTWAQRIMDFGKEIGFKPSKHKCFYRSKGRPSFRESCGCDAFGGEDITPIRIRSLPPERRNDVSEIASFLATSNLLFKAGYWQLANYLQEVVDRIIEFPVVPEYSGQLGYISYSHNNAYVDRRSTHAGKRLKPFTRWNKDLQCTEVLLPLFKGVKTKDERCLSEFLLSNLVKEKHELSLRDMFYPITAGEGDVRSIRRLFKIRTNYQPLT